MNVFKFGGASVKDAAAIRNVATILEKYKAEDTLIVVSAMGKTTNALEGVVKDYVNQKGEAFALLENIKTAHYQVVAELFGAEHEVFDELNDTFMEVEWVIEETPEDSYDYIYDQIVSIGEFASTKIIAAYLNYKNIGTTWLDARDVVLTDNTYRDGRVNWAETEKRANKIVPNLLKKNKFVVTQGFIGGTSENFTTTLGREGSDYSAAIFSYCLNADNMTIWKDVEGILTADPRLFKDVTKIEKLSYKEAIEMTYYGAKVIHPKTIKPIQNKYIPLYVRPFTNPNASGTVISKEGEITYPPVIVVEKNQTLLKISTRDFSFVAEHHLSQLFKLLADNRLKVNMMRNTAVSFLVAVNNVSDLLDTVLVALEKDFNVEKTSDLEVITIRHYDEATILKLKKNRTILLEERTPFTFQMVTRRDNSRIV